MLTRAARRVPGRLCAAVVACRGLIDVDMTTTSRLNPRLGVAVPDRAQGPCRITPSRPPTTSQPQRSGEAEPGTSASQQPRLDGAEHGEKGGEHRELRADLWVPVETGDECERHDGSAAAAIADGMIQPRSSTQVGLGS